MVAYLAYEDVQFGKLISIHGNKTHVYRNSIKRKDDITYFSRNDSDTGRTRNEKSKEVHASDK